MASKVSKGRARNSKCTYTERGRRCTKDGEGNPPLCRPHQIAVAAILNQQSRTPAQRAVDVFVDFLSGKRINEAEIMGVAQDLAGQWSGMGEQYRPPVGRDGQTDHREQKPQWTPESWQEFMNQQGFRRGTPPPPDPAQQELHVARLRARKVLGFTTSQKLTQAEVKHRQKAMARKNHPDLGGSTAKMAAINAAADVLLADPEIG